jgi:hypothetical protein
MNAVIENLKRQHPGEDVEEPFRRGYERGRDYYQAYATNPKPPEALREKFWKCKLVPGGGVEPPRPRRSADFESAAYSTILLLKNLQRRKRESV